METQKSNIGLLWREKHRQSLNELMMYSSATNATHETHPNASASAGMIPPQKSETMRANKIVSQCVGNSSTIIVMQYVLDKCQFVSLGIDCLAGVFFRQKGVKGPTLPFDWVVSYGGVYSSIVNNFENFTEIVPPDPKNNEWGKERTNKYDVMFAHDDLPNVGAVAKCERRIARFRETLIDDSHFVHFVRVCHKPHHHHEHSGVMTNELFDIKKFDVHLQTRHPHLNYIIWVILACAPCSFNFSHEQSSINNSGRIKLFSVVAGQTIDFGKFELQGKLEKLLQEIFDNHWKIFTT
jgi:Putative papain-like cysteine peptidase (DUF1796)